MEAVSFSNTWLFTRGLTRDLLESLDHEGLMYSPGTGLGPLWKQFRHVGRVQENYVEAMQTRRIRFDWTDTYRGGPSRDSLGAYLRAVDERMDEVLRTTDDDIEIDWSGEPIPIGEHLQRLVAHETLHHGQWVVYVQLMGGSFPPSWAAWVL